MCDAFSSDIGGMKEEMWEKQNERREIVCREERIDGRHGSLEDE